MEPATVSRMIVRLGLYFLGLVLLLVLCVAVYAFVIPRPLDTTDPRIFLQDGSRLNYCKLPELDGSGKTADDIPKAFTPGCGFTNIPMPVLAECTEPLSEGVVDMRGLWLSVSGWDGHIERIEQCGNRMVVTVGQVIHDFRVDGTLRNGARDVGAACNNFNSAIHFNSHGELIFRLFDLFDTVSREMQDDEMVFTFVDGTEIRTQKICHYPDGPTVDELSG